MTNIDNAWFVRSITLRNAQAETADAALEMGEDRRFSKVADTNR